MSHDHQRLLSTSATRLIAATPSHFDWAMRGPAAGHLDGELRLPPDGLDSPEVLSWIKRTSIAVGAVIGLPSAWLIACGDEVVGVISFKNAPRAGAAEIGYGVAAARRGRGHATAAVALIVAEAAVRGLDLVAETVPTNRSSQIVLERNGFKRCGERVDADDGVLLLWRRDR